MGDSQRTDISVQHEKAVLAAWFPKMPADAHLRDPLAELHSLADTAGAQVVGTVMQNLAKPSAATLMGKGKIHEMAAMVKLHEARVVIFENDLSPSQIRNIEEIVECKVLDRSELILDIFATRARSYESRLQVELAQLEYTYPRLKAMWSHLERIAGGAPAGIGTRGPGEQQLEIDRRIVQARKSELRTEISRVQDRKRREVEKRNVDFFTVGLVGYTNAGKSTLFNTLTDAGTYADDKLFATLDTRTRRWDLGGGDSVMVSDTVGFVRNLPHHLVASFRATLEESIHANLLLIVLDVADQEALQHLKTVHKVLDGIGATEQPRLLLMNKMDKIDDNTTPLLLKAEYPDALTISATQGVGVHELVDAVRNAMRGSTARFKIRVPLSDGKTLNFLENRAQITDRDYDQTHATLTLELGSRQMHQLRAGGAHVEILESQTIE